MTENLRRADIVLVERGLLESRGKARAAIAAGLVTADGVAVTKPSQKIAPDAVIEAEPAHPWVSRAALKLVAGLDNFDINPSGKICLDLGASTGGFSQVLIARSAAKVFAVDVGRDQLHATLRQDPKIISLESTDARKLTSDLISDPPELIVCDASFIGLEKVLSRPLELAAPACELVALIKPQFEVGRENIGKGGIVKDKAATEAAVERITAWINTQSEFSVVGVCESPITGGDGNVEFLIAARKG